MDLPSHDVVSCERDSLHTVAEVLMSQTVQRATAPGGSVSSAILAAISHYLAAHINRMGGYELERPNNKVAGSVLSLYSLTRFALPRTQQQRPKHGVVAQLCGFLDLTEKLLAL